MQLFVCWHGDRGHRLADILAKHLQAILSGLKVFVSSDIPKGVVWFEAVSEALQASDAGLICLTSDSLHSPWIHYEAGALAKTFVGESGRIYTYLVGVSPEDLTGPLSAYQSTAATLGDTKKLVDSLVGSMRSDERKANADWVTRFEAHWPTLEDEIGNVGFLQLQRILPGIQGLFRRKTFDEPVGECTTQSWLQRYNGARDTLAELRRHADRIAIEASRFVADAFDQLVEEVDGYVMDLGLLLTEHTYPLGDDGRVALPKGIERSCEEGRLTVKRLVSTLVDPLQAPVFDNALRFDRAETFEEKKDLIHRHVAALERGIQELGSDGNQLRRAVESDWAFDRIIAYKLMADRGTREARSATQRRSALRQVEVELEKATSREWDDSLMPLYYSLRFLEAVIGTIPIDSNLSADVSRLLDEVVRFAEWGERRDQGGEVRGVVARVRGQIQGDPDAASSSRKVRRAARAST